MTAIVDGRGAMAKLGVLGAQIEKASETAIRRSAAVIEREAKQNIIGRHREGTPRPDGGANTGPKTLMNVSGALRASIRVGEPRRVGFGAYEIEIGPTMVYARVQELGGGKNNIPARPYMAPALDDKQAEARDVFISSWRAVLTGGVLK